ncbi:hypothetical protein Q428_05755 [Fervidicella metallireducens AeB]|uniref:DUF2680 domain-containing protein n=1 Tax=Fervidicella metallireducens AeB TaxID=1403537 RepID=A0A017RW11_9CLOT|nr:hypothetical protein [Fervidicella metallireducens]EYE88877.1 hypothetical protein Q428_05755 [Fervidicella metallireducens AeB]
MRVKKLIAVLALTAAVGAGSTVYAATTQTSTLNRGLGLGRITSLRGYDYLVSILKNKLGLTDKQISDGLNSGKTMYDLAKEKGMTAEKFRALLLEEKNKAIDNAVSKGTITKEQGNALKETLKNNMNNCTGTPGQMQGKGVRGKGRMGGNGQRINGNCVVNGI